MAFGKDLSLRKRLRHMPFNGEHFWLHFKSLLKKTEKTVWGGKVVAYTFNPITQRAEADGSL